MGGVGKGEAEEKNFCVKIAILSLSFALAFLFLLTIQHSEQKGHLDSITVHF
jgi:hypothetical protein